MTGNQTNFYAGTSGLVLPLRKSNYPPEFQNKSRLEYYASLFNSIEINSSFYKTPQPATMAKWSAMAPEHFRFTLKFSKAVTHAKNFDFREEDVEAFMEAIKNIGDKKGCLLIQFPPSLTVEKLDRLQQLLSVISWANEDEWKLAVELRHRSWYISETYEILAEHKATLVLHDMPASAPDPEKAAGDFLYFRFHGPGGRYRESYSNEFLAASAGRICAARSARKTVFAYFNNTMGNAVNNLHTLNELCRG